MNFNNLDTTKPIQSQVYNAIEEAIIKLHFVPGQRISEQELSNILKVSRTPIREAFIRLAEKGLLEILPQRGTFVTFIDLNDVYEGLFIRNSLEVNAVKNNLVKIGDKEISVVESIIEEQKKSFHDNNIEQFYRLDEEFHKFLINISGYKNVWNIIKSANLPLDRVRYLSLLNNIKIDRLIDEHEKILFSIKSNDLELVEKNISDHLLRATQETIDLICEKYKSYLTNYKSDF